MLGVAETNARPAGKRSLMDTLVAALGAWLVTRIVKVMVSPTLGVELLTSFAMDRSACCGVSVTLAVLLAGIGSNWSLWLMAAVLVCGLGLTIWALKVSVALLPPARFPTVHR